MCDNISDSLVQLVVDDSRNILYTRSEKGTIQVQVLSFYLWFVNSSIMLAKL